ncbi:MAG: hypothetical protein IJV24_03275 [Prevotella sp.]|nr:hypothetical protein [Prevotella sp.]
MFHDFHSNPYADLPELPGLNDPNLTDEERERLCIATVCGGCLSVLLAFVLMIVLCLIFGSCTPQRTVVVETVRTDTLRLTQHERDSIFLRDSIYIRERTQGDTVFLEVSRWHTQYRDRWLHDSIYIARTDSVPVPYPVEKQVPAPLTAWQHVRLWLANLVLVALAVLAAVWLLKKRTWWLRLFK